MHADKSIYSYKSNPSKNEASKVTLWYLTQAYASIKIKNKHFISMVFGSGDRQRK